MRKKQLNEILDRCRRVVSSPSFHFALMLAIAVVIFTGTAYAQGTAEGTLDNAWKYFYDTLRPRLSLFALIPAAIALISRDPRTRFTSLLITVAILAVTLIPYFVNTLFKGWTG